MAAETSDEVQVLDVCMRSNYSILVKCVVLVEACPGVSHLIKNILHFSSLLHSERWKEKMTGKGSKERHDKVDPSGLTSVAGAQRWGIPTPFAFALTLGSSFAEVGSLLFAS